MVWRDSRVGPAHRDGPGRRSKTHNTSLKWIYTKLAAVLHQTFLGKQLGELRFETELQKVKTFSPYLRHSSHLKL